MAAAVALAVLPLMNSPVPSPLTAAAAAAAAPAATPPSGAITSVELTPMGSSDLAVLGHDGLVKPRGQNGDLAVLGNTAFVGAGPVFHGAQSTSGRICTDHGGVKVVDVSNPAAPAVTGVIDVDDTKSVLTGPRGNPRRGQFVKNVSTSVSALDAIRHPVVNKDILGIATQRCEPSFFNGGRIEFWDVTDRANPTRVGIYDGGAVQWGIFEEVKMFTRNDGPGGSIQVYALLATPFSVGNAHDATSNGDFRMLNITNPASPTVARMFPNLSIGQSTNNGCRTFMGGRSASPTPDGENVRFSFYDGAQPTNGFMERTGLGMNGKSAAVFDLDLDNMPAYNTGSSPRTFSPNPKTWGYDPAPSGGRTAAGTVEGNAADVEAFTGTGGESLTWVSEDDYDAALTNVSITSPANLHPDTRGCQNIIGKHLYSLPGQQLSGNVAYVGRGCPASPLINTSLTAEDPYLESPAGKIALVEGGGDGFNGCSWGDKVKRATAAGATAVVGNLGCCLSYFIPTGDGPIPSIPTVGVLYQVFNKMAGYVPDRVLSGTTFPSNWERSSATNVTVKPYALAVNCPAATFDTCQAVTNASPIVVNTGGVNHTLVTGDRVNISGVNGNTAANGTWTVTQLTATTFSLDGSIGNGSWTGGGIVRPCPAGEPNCGAVPIRTDFSRFKSVANATDRAARANVNASVVTLTAGATAAPATTVGVTQPTQTLSVAPLPRALSSGSTVRFANGEQAVLTAAAAAGATSITVQQNDSSVATAIPNGTTGSNAFEVVAGRAYKASATLEVETHVTGTYRAAVVWHDGSGAEVSQSEIGSRSAVTAGRERVTATVTAPAGAVRGSVKVEWTGGLAEGVAYADTITVVADGLAMNLKDLPGAACTGLTSWPPTTAQCGTAKPGWGAQRLLDFTPATPVEVGTYQSPNSKLWPPPNEGIFGPRQARMFGDDVAFTTWMSDGLRVLQVSNPAAPKELASYVPPAAADPTPGAGAGVSNRPGALNRGAVWPDVTLVTGVGIIPIDENSGYAVLSDINAGLKVVRFTINREPVTVSVSDSSPVAEGTAGAPGHTAGSARFTVSLSHPAPRPVNVSYATADGSATGIGAARDYEPTTGILRFKAGESSKVVTVPVTMDGSSTETDEDFFLDLSAPSAALTLADGRGRAVIYNDDATSSATLSVNEVTVMESTAGAPTQAIFTVSLSRPYAAPFRVRAFTADGTAHPAPHESNDYVQLNQWLDFARDEMTKQVAVTINNDDIAERDEIFYLALEDSTGPLRDKRQGVGTIVDDDNFPTVSIDDVVLTEGHSGTKEARFTVALSHPSFRNITVGYATNDGTARGTNHGVFGPADYTPVTGTLNFAPGQTTKSVVVVVNGDTIKEPDEEFLVQLPSAVNAVQAKRLGVGTIRNDD